MKKILLVSLAVVMTLAVGVVINGQIRRHRIQADLKAAHEQNRRMILESDHWSDAEKVRQIQIWEYNDKHK